jgi:HAD superfamily hydrolase (TIGR01509 family)
MNTFVTVVFLRTNAVSLLHIRFRIARRAAGLYNSRMKICRYDAIVFDMDGLLLDTERLAIEAWIEVSRQAGYDIPLAVMLHTLGLDEHATGRVILDYAGPGFPYESLKTAKRALMRRRMTDEGMPKKPGADALLGALREAGVPAALATSTDRERALWRINRCGWAQHFTALTFGDEVERGKPAPDIFALAARRMGVRPQSCAALEDSPGGLAAARAAGMTAILIPDMKAPDDALRRVAHYVFDDLNAAARHIFIG